MPVDSGDFVVYQCSNERCRFRFPAASRIPVTNCPRCKQPGVIIADRFNTPRVETLEPEVAGSPRVEVLLDNIRSVLNVGSMFRTADGAGIQKAYLCGITSTPDHPRIGKTGLGAEWSIPWEYHNNGLDLARKLKTNGYHLWAVEGGPDSVPVFSIQPSAQEYPILLVMGNENAGVDPGILAICDRVVNLPMTGYKRSLNVAVAFGVVAYYFQYCASSDL